MCNLYRLRANQAEVAQIFAAEAVPGGTHPVGPPCLALSERS
jgi:hypothetical protein